MNIGNIDDILFKVYENFEYNLKLKIYLKKKKKILPAFLRYNIKTNL
jgi:hypothetical protein